MCPRILFKMRPNFCALLSAISLAVGVASRTWDEAFDVVEDFIPQLTLEEKVGIVSGVGWDTTERNKSNSLLPTFFWLTYLSLYFAQEILPLLAL
ncbi:hypothetical protein QCA50_010104 [Cerrena zonata]|uniref:Uncharacterized protein n=1 Tax=Cerrena zonata TaxID=2478898 RepID=A0AAW0GA77_9APHY